MRTRRGEEWRFDERRLGSGSISVDFGEHCRNVICGEERSGPLDVGNIDETGQEKDLATLQRVFPVWAFFPSCGPRSPRPRCSCSDQFLFHPTPLSTTPFRLLTRLTRQKKLTMPHWPPFSPRSPFDPVSHPSTPHFASPRHAFRHTTPSSRFASHRKLKDVLRSTR